MWTVTTLSALLLFSSLVAIGVMIGLGASERQKTWALLIHIFIGSVVAGGLYLFIATLEPPQSAWNLLWFVGIPIVIAVSRRPRLHNLALTIPLVFGGWLACGLMAWVLHVPLD